MNEDNTYLTISKASLKIDVKPHVMRFWEKKFLIIRPKKNNNGGRRYYSPSDIEILFLIKDLLYNKGFTIKGAVKFIDEKYNNKTISNNNDLVFNSIYSELNKAIDLIKSGSKIILRNLN